MITIKPEGSACYQRGKKAAFVYKFSLLTGVLSSHAEANTAKKKIKVFPEYESAVSRLN